MLYYGRFKDIHNQTFKVEIITNNDQTESTEITLGDTPCVINQSSPDGLFSPIKSRSCTVTIVTKEPLFDIYTADSNGTSLCVYNLSTSECVFWGYVTPCQYNQSYLYLNELEIEAVDALSILQNYKYKNETYTTDYVIVRFLLKDICHNFFNNISNNQFTYDHIYFDYSVLESQEYYAILQASNFIDQDMTYYEVLAEICKFYGLTAVPSGRDLYILDYKKIGSGNAWYRVFDITLLNNGNKVINVSSTITADDYTGDGHNIELDAVYNKISIKSDINEDESEVIQYTKEDDFIDPAIGRTIYMNVYERHDGEVVTIKEYAFDMYEYKSSEDSVYSDYFELVKHGIDTTSYKTRYFYAHLVGGNDSTQWVNVTVTKSDETSIGTNLTPGTMDEDNLSLPELYGKHIQIIDTRSQLYTYYDLYINDEEAATYVDPGYIPYEIHEGAITSFTLEPNVTYTLVDDYGNSVKINSNATSVPCVIAATYGSPQIDYTITNQFLADNNSKLYKWAQYENNNSFIPKLDWNNMFVLSSFTLGCTDGRSDRWGELSDTIYNDFITQHYNDMALGTNTVGYFNLKQVILKSPNRILSNQPVDSYFLINGSVYICSDIYEDFVMNKQYQSQWLNAPDSITGRKNQPLGYDCIRCSLKVGDKYYYPNGTDETKWSTTPNIFALPICESELSWYSWVNFTNTVHYDMNIGSNSGYAVKIPANVVLNGEIELTLYTPTIPRLYVMQRQTVRDELSIPNKELPTCVLLKDLKIEYVISGEEERDKEDDDVVYSNEVTGNVLEYDDLEFKINTYSSKKPQAKSNILRETPNGLAQVEDCVSANDSDRQEMYIINKYLEHYSSPKIIYNCTVHGYKQPYEQIIASAIGEGKWMVVDEQEYDIKHDVNELKIIQY